MNVLPMSPWRAVDFSGPRLNWAERKQRARKTLRQATQVLVVLVLGGMLHAMRWAGMLVL